MFNFFCPRTRDEYLVRKSSGNLYEKFRNDLQQLSGDRLQKHSISDSLRSIERFVALIDNEKVHYRVLLCINTLKGNQGGIIGFKERGVAETELFPTKEDYDEAIVSSIARHVVRIREAVGRDALSRIITNVWQEASSRPELLGETVIPGFEPCCLSSSANDKSFNRIQEISRTLQRSNNSSSQTNPKWAPEYVEWPASSAESVESGMPSTSQLPQSSMGPVYEAPPTDLLTLVRLAFPDSHDVIIQHVTDLLHSKRPNSDLQGDLIDLLGFEHFDLVGMLLENREQICSSKQRAAVSGIKPTKTPAVLSQVTVQSRSQAEMKKEMRREQKRARRDQNRITNAFGDEEKLEMELIQREIMRQRQLEMESMTSMPKFVSAAPKEVFPFVFDSRIQANLTSFDFGGFKFVLPENAKREVGRDVEAVTVPAPSQSDLGHIEHVYVKDMDDLGRLGFKGFEKLNVIQSIVFEQAYKTKENLLICAPTGAGKTNIAMLTILNTIHEHRRRNGEIVKDDFKIIYIAPMKALATEMTENFGKRLAPLGLKVRELTGDTQLSKKEISETQMLILTPEKWDVVTRKNTTDNSLTALVRLLIIDEVHLLHDERGPVIETIVARTLRQVEMSQTGIRIVGLSATLPNYLDVARFLRVNPYKGLFFFDGRFRPVPLTQRFVGVQTKGGSFRDKQDRIDEVCYNEVMHHVRQGRQVLTFVHARNATARLAEYFISKASQNGELDLLLGKTMGTREYVGVEKAVQNCRNKGQLLNLFQRGLGIHHAGLVRHDRLLMEKAFGGNHIQILFCTATLAWGVNLPANAVVIRGTDVFDAEKGTFSDLGVLDVQQIFGRAGRPQFRSEGYGVIITEQAKLPKYLQMLIHQAPIESQFFKRIHDNLNAEIALGTVSTIDEAIEWLTYTYYYTRSLLNPTVYGFQHTAIETDPGLRNNFTQLLTKIAVELDDVQMIRFDAATNFVHATDLGRIASNFYIKFETIVLLKSSESGIGLPVSFTEVMTDDMIFGLVSMSSEFSNLKVREEEMADLEMLMSNSCMLKVVGGGLASYAGKVNVLLQSIVSRTEIRNFALLSEQFYVQQNAGRLCRAMFEIALRKNWSHATNAFLCIAKSIEQHFWPNQSSLRQLIPHQIITPTLVEKVERRQIPEVKLLEMSPRELGHMFSCNGNQLHDALKSIPRMEVEAFFKPITYTIVQVEVFMTPAFIWNDRFLGKGGAQSFFLFLENINENLIMHVERLAINKVKVVRGEPQHLVFTIPVRDHQLTNNYQLRVTSEHYMVQDTVVPLSLHNCILPKSYTAHTDLLNLDPLPVKTLRNSNFEAFYKFPYFNPIQTQVFFCLYKTDESALIGAPTGSGKTLCAELAMFRLIQQHPKKKIVYIAPLKALVRERVDDWKAKFEKLGYKVVEVSGDVTPDTATLSSSTILITTPEKWDGISRNWSSREYVREVGLIVLDEVHLLGIERGAVLEAIVTRLKMITRRSATREEPARLLGLSTALANAGDVAEWLGIKDHGLYNFRPSVRPIPISVHIQGFPGQHYCPRMALMNKPAFRAIMTYSPEKPVLVFVASRRQTRLTAMAFVNQLVVDSNPRQWLHMDMQELEVLMQSVKDENLKLTLPFGIGLHHAGLSPHERSLVEQLYIDKKIQILIATATLAWGINCPAHLVIVKGTEFYDGKTCKYVDFPVTDVLQMMGRAGRPQFDDSAVAVIYVQDSKKTFYKKFLYEPFPVESSLLPVFPNHVNAEIHAGTIDSKQSIVEYLSGTYLYRRLFVNPNFYGLEELSEEAALNFITNAVDHCVGELLQSKCIVVDEENKEIRSSPYGRLASVYYLQHKTIRFLLEELKSTSTIEDMLRIMTHVPEYAEIPVRHNEDLLNTDLQKTMRIRFPTSAMDSSHTKTHLLFQAFFMRMTLQTDYRTDQKSVLDQCVRIMQAMREICVLHQWCTAVMNVTYLQQMCHTGRWYDDHPLTVLPHLDESDANRLGPDLTVPLLQMGLSLFEEKSDSSKEKKFKQKFVAKTTLDEKQINEVMNAVKRYPTVTPRHLRLVAKNEEIDVSDFGSVGAKTQRKWIKVSAGALFRLKLDLHVAGSDKFAAEAFLPLWPKEKAAGWMILAADLDTDQLLSFSYVPPVRGSQCARIEVKMPSKSGRFILSLVMMSDCYLGIDQEYSIPVEVC